ncbi:hypothetical protein ACFQT0_20790 [Hymenobacter humi]|uniref:Uncharacterized protein n=1 Tax=Hymenobacter humi TaxID=1411620 RepID=A0ABW2UAY8_9BACT
MNTLLTTSSDTGTGLPKWQKPEKIAGRVVLLGLVGAAVYYWGKILPFLVDIVFNSVKLGIGLGVLFVLFLLVTNKRIHAGLWYAGQRILRTLAGIFVNTDPIGIMQDYIKNTEQEARKMDAEVTNIEGAHEPGEAQAHRQHRPDEGVPGPGQLRHPPGRKGHGRELRQPRRPAGRLQPPPAAHGHHHG